MLPKYESLHQHTSDTLPPENPLESGKEDIAVPDEGDAASYLMSPSIHGTLVLDTEAGAQLRARTRDLLLLGAIFTMLMLPWIFLTIIWARGGVQMHNNGAKLVINYPQINSFVTTLLGNIVGVITSILFSLAVIRLAQEWVTNNDHVTVFDVSLISAFRHQNWPWCIEDYKHLLVRNRWFSVALTGACLAAFAFVPPGMTSLISPVPFYRTTPLTGTELDFSSNASDCVNWFEANEVSGCDWTTYNGLEYAPCAWEGGQMIDILESGRNNMILTISNNSETLSLGQLGANSSHHFLGPVRGVLPTGPNGLAAINTLQVPPLNDAQTRAVTLSYNYTLDQQGLDSNISCIYDTQSPIIAWGMQNNTYMLEDYGTCDGLAHVFGHITSENPITVPNNYKTLLFWACKSIPTVGEDPVYYIYLRGFQNYATAIGNITCTVSQIQPAIFPVIYQSKKGIFSTKELIRTSKPGNTTLASIEMALSELGNTILQSQSGQSNVVAESVIALGVQSLGLSPNETNKAYLPLYAAMIQGILVNQVTYTRFLYSTVTDPAPPPSCIRTVNGILSAEVIGWVAKSLHIGVLIPMTIINVIALVIILKAIFRSKGGCYEFDPTDPRPLVSAKAILAEGDPSGWANCVSYRPREWLTEKNSV